MYLESLPPALNKISEFLFSKPYLLEVNPHEKCSRFENGMWGTHEIIECKLNCDIKRLRVIY